MPAHNAYSSGNDINVGSVISIAAGTLEKGDELSIEYPNHGRASGKVTQASPNELEVEIGLQAWRLRPHAPSDGTIHNNLAGADASFWTFQSRL